MAREGRERPTAHHEPAEPGQPADDRPHADRRPRRVGARLLPQVPEQAPRLHRRVLQRGELGRGGEEVQRVS